tara:strand:+ start:287 stop:469 length:183 start_codon:yes stop_codon:yes gene_type:complete
VKVGDIVLPRENWATDGVDYGIGVLIDVYVDDDGMEFFEVQWSHEKQWWKSYEMKVVSDE